MSEMPIPFSCQTVRYGDFEASAAPAPQPLIASFVDEMLRRGVFIVQSA